MNNERLTYVPGACNIGPAERRQRLRFGLVGAVVTAAAWALFFVFRVPAPWRVLLLFPAAMAATGFLQWGLHFCAGFGYQGVFNFGPEVGKAQRVGEEEARAKDRRKAFQIFIASFAIGVVVAAVGFFAV